MEKLIWKYCDRRFGVIFLMDDLQHDCNCLQGCINKLLQVYSEADKRCEMGLQRRQTRDENFNIIPVKSRPFGYGKTRLSI